VRNEKWIYDKLDMLTFNGVDGAAIGDEGCIYKVLSDNIISITSDLCEADIPIRFITPFVPDKYVEVLYERIKKLSDYGKIKVVFNDYGMLHKCKSLIEANKIIAVLGRILTRSIIDCPWGEQLLRNEEEDLSNVVLGFSTNHNSKKELFKEYGIEEIEINTPKLSSNTKLLYPDLKLTMYRRSSIMSVGRVCFTARYRDAVLPRCIEEKICNEEIDIELVKKWGKTISAYEDMNEYNKVGFDNLYIKGNIVYRKIDEDDFSQYSNNLYCCIN
jgi:hypothetical protein